jgi:hypothetical protein
MDGVMQTSKTGSDNACGELADYLSEHKASLMQEWLGRVRGDSIVLSDPLTQLELLDHVPNIFDALVGSLRTRCFEATVDIQEITARHTVIRWVQHYDLRSVLREVSILRTVLVEHLMKFNETHRNLSSASNLLNATIVHCILDDIVMDATETFLKLSNRDEGNGA